MRQFEYEHLKPSPAAVQFAVLLAAAMLLGGQGFCQPANSLPVPAGDLNPAAGLRASGSANAVPADNNPSLAAFSAFNREFASNAVRSMDGQYGWPAIEVDGMIGSGRNDEALQQLRRFVHLPRKDRDRLDGLLIRWFVLSDRFPKAREALVLLRNQDVRELSRGQGSLELFTEVNSINQYLQQQDPRLHPDEAVCGLFKLIRERNKPLAAQCYPEAQSWLVQQGEYELCLAYIGSPQACFESLRNTFEKQVKVLPLYQEAQRRSRQRTEEMLSKARQNEQERQSKMEQHRLALEKNIHAPPGVRYTPPPRPARPVLTRPQVSFDLGPVMTNYFVGKTCELVEVLVGTGRRADADQIRNQAVTALDHPRFKSAVTDAEERVQKRSLQTRIE